MSTKPSRRRSRRVEPPVGQGKPEFVSRIPRQPMTYDEVRNMPTTIDGAKGKCHESLLRSYQILEKTKVLLANQTAPHLVLELILMMEGEKSWPNL